MSNRACAGKIGLVWVVTVCGLLLWGGPVPYAAPRPKNTFSPVKVTFRTTAIAPADSTGTNPNTPSPSAFPVAPGDGWMNDVAGSLEGEAQRSIGSYIVNYWGSTTNDLTFVLSGQANPMRTLMFDFRQEATPCTGGASCRKNFATMAIGETIYTNAVRPGTYDPQSDSFTPLEGGLLGMPADGETTYQANVWVNFAYENRIWTVRYNSQSGCYAEITREPDLAGVRRWTVTTNTQCTRAILVQSKDGSTRGQVNEGTFYMPFSMTVEQVEQVP